MILGTTTTDFGDLGRTKSQWQSYRSGLSTKKRNILDLKVALFWISAQTQDGDFNPQDTKNQYDLNADFSVELAQAVIELADAVLKKIGVTGQVPGLNTLLSLATNRYVVGGAYAAQKNEINGYIQSLANSVVSSTNKVLDFLDKIRNRLDTWDKKLTLSDLRAVFEYIIKGGSAPPVPSLGEREGSTAPTVPFKPKVVVLAPFVTAPTGFPPGAFAVHDPARSKWRVFVRA